MTQLLKEVESIALEASKFAKRENEIKSVELKKRKNEILKIKKEKIGNIEIEALDPENDQIPHFDIPIRRDIRI